MKRFFLFAAPEGSESRGATALVGDFETASEALVGVLDLRFVTEFWHILDTETGEIVDRSNIKTQQNMLGFQKSDWTAQDQFPKPTAIISTAPAKTETKPITLASTNPAPLPSQPATRTDPTRNLEAALKPNGAANGARQPETAQ